MKEYVTTKNKYLTGRRYEVVYKEKHWVTVDLGEKRINKLGWPPDRDQIERYNFNPLHYYYWLSDFKFVRNLEEIEL